MTCACHILKFMNERKPTLLEIVTFLFLCSIDKFKSSFQNKTVQYLNYVNSQYVPFNGIY